MFHLTCKFGFLVILCSTLTSVTAEEIKSDFTEGTVKLIIGPERIWEAVIQEKPSWNQYGISLFTISSVGGEIPIEWNKNEHGFIVPLTKIENELKVEFKWRQRAAGTKQPIYSSTFKLIDIKNDYLRLVLTKNVENSDSKPGVVSFRKVIQTYQPSVHIHVHYYKDSWTIFTPVLGQRNEDNCDDFLNGGFAILTPNLNYNKFCLLVQINGFTLKWDRAILGFITIPTDGEQAVLIRGKFDWGHLKDFEIQLNLDMFTTERSIIPITFPGKGESDELDFGEIQVDLLWPSIKTWRSRIPRWNGKFDADVNQPNIKVGKDPIPLKSRSDTLDSTISTGTTFSTSTTTSVTDSQVVPFQKVSATGKNKPNGNELGMYMYLSNHYSGFHISIVLRKMKDGKTPDQPVTVIPEEEFHWRFYFEPFVHFGLNDDRVLIINVYSDEEDIGETQVPVYKLLSNKKVKQPITTDEYSLTLNIRTRIFKNEMVYVTPQGVPTLPIPNYNNIRLKSGPIILELSSSLDISNKVHLAFGTEPKWTPFQFAPDAHLKYLKDQGELVNFEVKLWGETKNIPLKVDEILERQENAQATPRFLSFQFFTGRSIYYYLRAGYIRVNANIMYLVQRSEKSAEVKKEEEKVIFIASKTGRLAERITFQIHGSPPVHIDHTGNPDELRTILTRSSASESEKGAQSVPEIQTSSTSTPHFKELLSSAVEMVTGFAMRTKEILITVILMDNVELKMEPDKVKEYLDSINLEKGGLVLFLNFHESNRIFNPTDLEEAENMFVVEMNDPHVQDHLEGHFYDLIFGKIPMAISRFGKKHKRLFLKTVKDTTPISLE